ncbi:Uncharacterised protein [Niallia circulans]|jgi:hypothetical protein|uniref:hypothetical protein n=2 Tax=Bacillaceae TaxID=186817 RepID=UPI000AC9D3B6|nr:hypothetical protein [Niallia circulans]MDR4315375.1 hypothetical protein [Niallia circulans]MED3841705.1 hypothetical protein [Niallia circulans]MED4248264.1 hypothetical protein [Niallia circulans]QKH61279.1 hypothetical protein FOC77_11820 [Niallia circulans]SPU11389.1 Uncharacterised protein [Niallia circulans]
MMNKLHVLIKILITGLGLLLILTNIDTIWYNIFIVFVIVYLIYDLLLNMYRKKDNGRKQ